MLIHSQVHSCDDGDVRLSEGVTAFEGRVDICIDGLWTPVCADGFPWDYYDTWGGNEAAVVCRQLTGEKHPSKFVCSCQSEECRLKMCIFTLAGASAVHYGIYGLGDYLYTDNYFSSVSCNGSEQNLLQCAEDDSYDYYDYFYSWPRFRYCNLYFGAVGVICYGRFLW